MQEINELKNLVVQSLESHGVLSQLRAQIRSSVFKIIDMQETQNNKRPNSFFWENPLCQKIYENEHGSLAVELITEMLQFYKMDYTLSVFPHEANLKEEVTREKLSKKLSINPDNEKGIPLLIYMIKAFFSNGNSSFEKRPFQEIKVEESKEEIKEMPKNFTIKDTFKEQVVVTKEVRKEIPAKEPEPLVRTKELPVIQPKKEQEVQKEIIQFKDNKKPEPKEVNFQGNKPQQPQPLPAVNQKPNQKNFDNFQSNDQKEIKPSNKIPTDVQQAKDIYGGGSDINREKKTLVETQQKMGDFEKKIVSKQIAEIPALPIKQEIEKPMAYNIPPGMEKKNLDIQKKKDENSQNYEDEHFDEYNEEVNEEIFHEDENIEEMMYRQQEGQMDPHGQQGLQSSDENFGASQSQGFDILVNSTTLEEYDYFEDVANP